MGQTLSRRRDKAFNAGENESKQLNNQSPTVISVGAPSSAPAADKPRKGRRIASIEISRVATNSYREASQRTSDAHDPTQSIISARQILINPLSEGFATAAAAKLASSSPAASQGPALQHSGSHGARIQTGGGAAIAAGSASPRALAPRAAPASGSGACVSVPLSGTGRYYAANGDAGVYAVISHTSVTQGGSGLVSGNGVASRHGSGASSGTDSSILVSRRNSAVGCVGSGTAPQRSRLGQAQAQAQAQAHPTLNTGQGQGQGQGPAAHPASGLSPLPPQGQQPAHRWRPQGAAVPAARAATYITAPGPRLPSVAAVHAEPGSGAT